MERSSRMQLAHSRLWWSWLGASGRSWNSSTKASSLATTPGVLVDPNERGVLEHAFAARVQQDRGNCCTQVFVSDDHGCVLSDEFPARLLGLGMLVVQQGALDDAHGAVGIADQGQAVAVVLNFAQKCRRSRP